MTHQEPVEDVGKVVYELGDLLLSVDGVSSTYKKGAPLILEEVDASVYDIIQPDGPVRGQIIALLGPSGVGKTTLFEIMAGLRGTTSGQVTLHFNGSTAPVSAGQVGVVSQHYLVFDHRKVLSNLVLAGRFAGLSRSDARVRGIQLLQHFGLEGQMNLFPRQLSGGQRQRVAIAQQLMGSGRLLLMDEPFSGLDPVMKTRVCELITDVASLDEENTIIVVTHDVRAAVSVADTLWIMGHPPIKEGDLVRPGARILETHNLVEKGIAWRPDIVHTALFNEYVRTIEERFPSLI